MRFFLCQYLHQDPEQGIEHGKGGTIGNKEGNVEPSMSFIFHDAQNFRKEIERKKIAKSCNLDDQYSLQHKIGEALRRSSLILRLDGNDGDKQNEEGGYQ